MSDDGHEIPEHPGPTPSAFHPLAGWKPRVSTPLKGLADDARRGLNNFAASGSMKRAPSESACAFARRIASAGQITEGAAKVVQAHLSEQDPRRADLAAQQLVHKRRLLDYRDAAKFRGGDPTRVEGISAVAR